MHVELVTADGPFDELYADERAPAAGIVIGVFCGALFWFALGLGIAFGMTIWN